MNVVLGERVDTSAMPDALQAYFHTPLHVQAMPVAGDEVEVDVTWPECTPIDARSLFGLTNYLAPVKDVEKPYAVIKNWGGIHEQGEFARHIMDKHRELFPVAWPAMAASRQILLSVLKGANYGIGYDQSHAINDRACMSVDEAKKPVHVIPALARLATGKMNVKSPDDPEATGVLDLLGTACKSAKRNSNLESMFWTDDYSLEAIQYFMITRYTENKEVDDMNERAILILKELDALGVSAEQAYGVAEKYAYESFTTQEGDTYYLDRSLHRTEEDISLQAHYNQRHITIPWGGLYYEGRVRMELPNGSDDPTLIAIPSEDFQRNIRSPYFSARPKAPPTVKPVLRWRVDLAGRRKFCSNAGLAPYETRFTDGVIVYADVLVGQMLLAACHSEITNSWPKEARFNAASPDDPNYQDFIYKRIPIGDAQTPLLTAISSERSAWADTQHRLEQAA